MTKSASKRLVVGFSSWRGRDREKEKVRSDMNPKKGSEPFQGRKKIVVTPSPSTSSIKCFKRVVIVKDDGQVASDSSYGETSTSSELESCSDDSHVKGDLLTVKRLMGS
ncbi:hypothetical protein CR513_37276, partial [Mucuna pruriens]